MDPLGDLMKVSSVGSAFSLRQSPAWTENSFAEEDFREEADVVGQVFVTLRP